MDHRQQVRPRLVDLAELDDEGQDAPLNWPPAARVTRKGPPSIGERHVRFAGEAATEPGGDAEPTDKPKGDSENNASTKLAVASPFVGSIMERSGTAADPPVRQPGAGTSRFRAMRAADKTHGMEKMSAFRRARTDRAQSCAAPSTYSSRDPGAGAPPEQIAAMLAGAAAENEGRIAHMSHADVESELADATAFFGADVLDKLRSRRAHAPPRKQDDAPSTGWPAVERLMLNEPPARPPPAASAVAELEDIRSRYFPEEPSALNPSLEWTVRTEDKPSTARFDFEGCVIARPSDSARDEPSNETFLAGLHLHGNEQSTPGYSVEELLHLAQSTVASQRALAVQVLGRVCTAHHQRLRNGAGKGRFGVPAGDADAHAALDADDGTPRARIMLVACWLLADRHRSVRNAALSCLAGAVKSVSVDAPFAHSAARACTPFAVDPYLDWKWLAETHDVPRAAPSAFSDCDASYLELVQRNWASALVRIGAVDSLDRIAAAESLDSDTAVQDDIVTIAHALATHLADAATLVADRPALLRLVLQLGVTARAWPPSSSTLPDARALEIILAAVRSSRAAANALVRAGIVDPLLRYMLLPPLDTNDSLLHELFSLTLQVYAALARYGENSASVRDAFPGIDRIGRWCASALENDAHTKSVTAFFGLLTAWTNASLRDPHHGDLGANWPTVREWIRFSVETYARLEKMPRPSAPVLVAGSAALEHVAAWTTTARQLEPALLSEPRLEFNYAVDWQFLCGSPAKELLLRIYPALEERLGASDDQSALYCYGCMQLIGAWARIDDAWRTDLSHIQRHAARSRILAALVSPRATASGGSALRPTILAACLSGNDCGGNSAVLSTLGPEDAQLAAALMHDLATPEWPVLEPFLRENVHGADFSAALAVCAANSQVPPILSVRDALGVNTARQEATDTITGSALWRCASAGLPIRTDWPFLALDDLLHSASAAVFNGGALPTAWDFSEADIVRSSLQLAVRMLDQGIAGITSAHIWLALSKVFLLEDDKSTGQFSGAATGKDIYADAAIEPLIGRLEQIADERADTSISLENVSVQVGGAHASYYEVFTDLIGLYDAISFGNPHFARAILVATAMSYPRDYARLLWSDYSHIIKSMHISLADAPAAPIDSNRVMGYMYPLERDTELLARYAHALATGLVTPVQEFLYNVALHHVSGALWSSLEPGSWRDVMSAPSLAALLRGSTARDAVLTYIPPGGDAPSPERATLLQ